MAAFRSTFLCGLFLAFVFFPESLLANQNATRRKRIYLRRKLTTTIPQLLSSNANTTIPISLTSPQNASTGRLADQHDLSRWSTSAPLKQDFFTRPTVVTRKISQGVGVYFGKSEVTFWPPLRQFNRSALHDTPELAINRDVCRFAPCRNNGTCHANNDDEDDYFCSCPPGSAGKDCTESDFCASHACKNGAQCEIVPGQAAYRCKCAKNWSGDLCDIFCPEYVCQNGGSCIFDKATKSYGCACIDNWSGKTCEKEANPCESSPCLNGGVCTSKSFNAFTCACSKGFIGQRCQQPCVDVYKSCSRWKEEDRCSHDFKRLTPFFDSNCPVQCDICQPPNKTAVALDYPPFPPVLDAFRWLVGTWVANVTTPAHYPFDFVDAAAGYAEQLSFLVTEVPMFGSPSINFRHLLLTDRNLVIQSKFSMLATNNRNLNDIQLSYGFLMLKGSKNAASMSKLAALMSTSNNGISLIEEGTVNSEKQSMKLKLVHKAGLPYMTWRLPKESIREFTLLSADQLRVQTRLIADKDDKIRDFEVTYRKISGRKLY